MMSDSEQLRVCYEGLVKQNPSNVEVCFVPQSTQKNGSDMHRKRIKYDILLYNISYLIRLFIIWRFGTSKEAVFSR